MTLTTLPACPACRTVPQPCSFCGQVARYFIDANVGISIQNLAHLRTPGTVYFCDEHADTLLGPKALDGDARVEIGLYCPNTQCRACNTRN
jgi:hypothetical protein